MYKSEESLSLDVPLIAEERKTRKMRNNGKTRYYSPLQVFVAFTFVLVIFLTAKYTSVSSIVITKRPVKVSWLSEQIFNVTRHPPPPLLKVRKKVNGTYEYVIQNQMARIEAEMYRYPFRNGQELQDLIPDQGGQPVRALVSTTWRSGSTFLGDILLSHPATYYHYEPLLHFYIHQVRDGTPRAAEAIKVIKSLFDCDYSDLGSFLEYAKVHLESLSHNERLWSQCFGGNRKHCFEPEFLSQFCSLFPFQSLKTVRVRLNLTRQFIEDPKLNVQVLLLVRDPRGTLQSRKHRVWCPGNPDCDQPEHLCSDLVEDYHVAQKLIREFPTRIRVIRYEDFCQDIEKNARRLLDFFGFEMHPQVLAFINSHTHSDRGGVSSTFRDSKNAPYHWRQDLSFSEVENIQTHCQLAMKLWGYKPANSQDDLDNLQPLLNYTL